MLAKTFFNKLRDKYNYDDKTMKALVKIVPCIVSYYGEEYEYLVLEALLHTEIIPCDSKQTISKVMSEKRLTRFDGDSMLCGIDYKKQESVYFLDVLVSYNDDKNIYEIKDLNRVIVTSHTYNYDSPKGLEVLTHALCHMVKSYKDEIRIDENKLIIRSGISYEERKIVFGDEISLSLEKSFGMALEEGFTIYDTEMIVSMVLHDLYKCYDYDSIYMIAYVLKEKYKFINEINDYEINGDIEGFKKCYKSDVVDRLALICDECIDIENDMHLSYTREDKDKIAKVLNDKLERDAYSELISIYEYNKGLMKKEQ